MSGFYGVFSPVQPINALAFQQMSAHAGSDGFDAHETHQSAHLAMGHLMLRTSPEAVFDKQPLVSACGRFTLTGHFRLDYRDELGDKLGLGFLELKTVPDSMLVMMAFEKWQEDCVHHLEGDWAFVLYDSKENRLFLVKDQSGISALFHIRVGDQVFFASNTTTILAVKEHRFEIHHENLIRYTRPGHYPEGGETLIRELYYVNNGEFLFYNAGLEKAAHTYWSMDDSKMIQYTHEEDYVHGLFSVYSAAVRSRLRSDHEIGIFLSGGLDSSSVAALAASELKRQGRVLNSYTSFPHFEALLPKNEKIMANEVPLVKELVKQYDNIRPYFDDFPEASLKDEFSEQGAMDAYYPIVSKNSFWINGIMMLAHSKGNRRILTGQLGNFTITWTSPFVYVSMFIKFRFVSFFSAVKRDLISSQIGFFLFVKQFVLSPLKIKILSVFQIRAKKDNKLIFPFQNPPFFKKGSKMSQMLYGDCQNLEKIFSDENEERKRKLGKLIPFGGIKWALEEQRYKVEVVDPTADQRLILYSIKLPLNMFYKSGVSKFIFKMMIGGVLPKLILQNRQIKIQSFDFSFRLKADESFGSFLRNEIFVFDHNNIKNIKRLYREILKNPGDYIFGSDIHQFLKSVSLQEFLKKIV